jgi:hypothetical protein
MSTELAVIEPEYIDPFDEPDLQTEIDTLLFGIRNQELTLATSFARLGHRLHRVQAEKKWVDWGYASFGKYIDFVRERINRGRSQIYAILSCAERLLPSVSESDLDHMGISRAQELARFVKQSGRKVPEGLLLLALDNSRTIEELHSAVLEELHERCDPKGNWYDFGGFYILPDEKKEIEQAIGLAKTVLGIANDVPEHQVRKLILLAFAQEFQSSNPVE